MHGSCHEPVIVDGSDVVRRLSGDEGTIQVNGNPPARIVSVPTGVGSMASWCLAASLLLRSCLARIRELQSVLGHHLGQDGHYGRGLGEDIGRLDDDLTRILGAER